MTLYFAWATPHEEYNAHQHARQDEAVFDLEITQKEGGFAHARITVVNPHIGLLHPTRHQHCFISYKNAEGIHLLFKGRIIGIPTPIKGELVHLQFTAEPHDRREKLEALCQTLRTPPFWDTLFVTKQSLHDPLETLEARSSLFYWSRTQGAVTLSDIFQGGHKINLNDQFYYDSLEVDVGPPPLEAVRICIVAEWTQRYAGEVDLAPLIAASFPEGIINTMTGMNLQSRWWQTSDYILFPNYHIIESSLEKIIPPRTGLLNLYPLYSPFFWTGPQNENPGTNTPENLEERQRVRFKRSWFRGCLRIGWRYHQRRRESATFTLHHHTQKIAGHNRRQRTLTLFLQDIVGDNHFWLPHFSYQRFARVIHEGQVYRCRAAHISGAVFEPDLWEPLHHCQHVSDQASRATFFLTDRGKQAIAHAIEIGRAHLALSARMIILKCRTPFDTLFKITTDHSLALSDARLPGGHAEGKVIAYRLCMEGQTGRRYVDVTIAAAVGADTTSLEPPAALDAQDALYMQDAYCAEEAVSPSLLYEGRTPSGITYRLDGGQYPTLGLLHPSSLTAKEIVQDLQITNTPGQQIQRLRDSQYPKHHNLLSVLHSIPTTITLRLLDLSSRDVLNHSVNVDIPFAWSAPQQIDLGAGTKDSTL